MARVPRTRAAPSLLDEHARCEDFWDEPAPAERHLATDLDRLQGAWMAVCGRRPAEILVSGRRLTVHFADGDIYMGSFSLVSGRVGTIDVCIEEGPSRHRGMLALGIYELDGDTLRWCTAAPGDIRRPSAFDEHNPQLLCLILRREHPADWQ